MTPEDLTAIGIKKPHDREKIKQHIDALQLPDSLPNYVPVSTYATSSYVLNVTTTLNFNSDTLMTSLRSTKPLNVTK